MTEDRPGTTGDEVDLHEVRRGIEAFIDRQLVPLRELSRRLSVGLDITGVTGVADDVEVDEATVAEVLGALHDELNRAEALVGLGFAAEDGVMRGRDDYLLWFLRTGDRIRRLALNLDPGDFDFYDYRNMDWYSRARQLRAPSIYGPYLDYAGADRLVHTVAVPVLVGARFVGIAGGDLEAEIVESRLHDLLHLVPGDVVVVNQDRVVVAATGARWLPGERLGTHPVVARHEWDFVAEVGDWTGWVLAAGPRTGPA